jgi:hypothetical protein
VSGPNFFTDPAAFNRVKIGGQLLKAVLIEVSGIKLEADWTAQKATGTSGPTWVFKGMNAAGPHSLKFKCGNGGGSTAAEQYDDLRALYERFGPVKQSTGGPAAKVGDPYTKNGTAPANADAGGVIPSGATTPTDSSGFPKSSGTNPGPKPPTLSIENGFVNYLGTTACSLKSWDGPNPTDTASITVTIEIIPQKAPVKAGTGVAAPKVGDDISGGGAAASAADADKKAAAAGAGT